MQPRFAYVPRSADPSGYRTSEIFLVEAAVRAARLLSKSPFFDIRFLGASKRFCSSFAIGALVAACRDLGSGDAGNGGRPPGLFLHGRRIHRTLNSLYSQTASLLFLLATAGVRRPRGPPRVAVGSAPRRVLPGRGSLRLCGKPQEVVHAPILALLGVRLAWPNAPAAPARGGPDSQPCCSVDWRPATTGAPKLDRLGHPVQRHLHGPASGLPDPAADLVEMGLDPSLAKVLRRQRLGRWISGKRSRDSVPE
jgi:hypothetical protein